MAGELQFFSMHSALSQPALFILTEPGLTCILSPDPPTCAYTVGPLLLIVKPLGHWVLVSPKLI